MLFLLVTPYCFRPPPSPQVFDLARAVSNPEDAHQSNFLHPIVRLWLPYDDRAQHAHWARGKAAAQARVPELQLEPLTRFPFTFAGVRKASEHHVIEDFLLRFDSEVCVCVPSRLGNEALNSVGDCLGGAVPIFHVYSKADSELSFYV